MSRPECHLESTVRYCCRVWSKMPTSSLLPLARKRSSSNSRRTNLPLPLNTDGLWNSTANRAEANAPRGIHGRNGEALALSINLSLARVRSRSNASASFSGIIETSAHSSAPALIPASTSQSSPVETRSSCASARSSMNLLPPEPIASILGAPGGLDALGGLDAPEGCARRFM